MAKNKNQNQNRQQREPQQHERHNPGSDEHMAPDSTGTEERIMPSAPQSARKGQKKFGHN